MSPSHEHPFVLLPTWRPSFVLPAVTPSNATSLLIYGTHYGMAPDPGRGEGPAPGGERGAGPSCAAEPGKAGSRLGYFFGLASVVGTASSSVLVTFTSVGGSPPPAATWDWL